MPDIWQFLERTGTPLTRVDTILAAYSADQLDAGVREHFKKLKDGSMKCGLCGASCPHPKGAQAHMAENHMKELKAAHIKSRIKGFGMKIGHKMPNPSMKHGDRGGAMGHRRPNATIFKPKPKTVI